MKSNVVRFFFRNRKFMVEFLGTVRTNTVGELCFRVRMYIYFQLIPIPFVISDFFPMNANRNEPPQKTLMFKSASSTLFLSSLSRFSNCHTYTRLNRSLYYVSRPQAIGKTKMSCRTESSAMKAYLFLFHSRRHRV